MLSLIVALILVASASSWVQITSTLSRNHHPLFGSFFEEELPTSFQSVASSDSFTSAASNEGLDLAPSSPDITVQDYHVTFKTKRIKAQTKPQLFDRDNKYTGAPLTASSSRRFLVKGLVGAAVLGLTSASSAPPAEALSLFGGSPTDPNSPVVYCDEDVMAKKSHGTTAGAVGNVRWGVDSKMADKICSFNRHFAEPAGSFEKNDAFLTEVSDLKDGETITYYDTVTNLPLFTAPVGRTKDQFLQESYTHGWPSFRDSEVNWENTRVLKSTGETVSKDGTHLGHNLPDGKGNRYCINLVSVAGVGVKA
ncbi:hypothetical protein TrVE_jg3135 [Triparma verrucosa]|uniref:Uncharacterized protein n=2 Tax=Triparma TaxID=722752 RepID=A0A9W7BXU5_9STRA|nr:hypothetical protein TrVE_jg3135 [Triparma verrucosa]GMH96090.1 hypothetical protein TrST_g4625 [Triparma strigata]